MRTNVLRACVIVLASFSLFACAGGRASDDAGTGVGKKDIPFFVDDFVPRPSMPTSSTSKSSVEPGGMRPARRFW